MKSGFNPSNGMGMFNTPGRIIFGSNTAKQAGATAKAMGAKKAVIIAGPTVIKTGIAANIKKDVEAEQIAAEIYEREGTEPTSSGVDRCADFVREGRFDLVIGLGGGSGLDTAKVVSALAANEGSVLNYHGMAVFPRPALRKILIPTSAGSGAEITPAGGYLDTTSNTKTGLMSDALRPDVVILDPLLTLSTPIRFAVETAVDAMVHALEGYVSRAFPSPFTDVFAPEVFRLVKENAPVVAKDPQNLDARFNLLLASTYSGLGGGIAAVHGLAFCLEAVCGLSHARAVCVMLPYVVEHSYSAFPERFGRFADILGEDVKGLAPEAAASGSVRAIRKLLSNLGISTRLADYDITEKALPDLLENMKGQAMWFNMNVKPVTEADAKVLFMKALA
jgi:alcohol dehydrogenase